MAEQPELPEVELYTDGACSGNPGPGGWAVILVSGEHRRELSGGEPHTTNNRMELMAVIRGLQTLKKPAHVKLFTDSKYVGQGISEWMPKWKANGWRRKPNALSNSPIKNLPMWIELDGLLARHRLTFVHVLGHSGHVENERCDKLAVAAYQQFLAKR